MAKRPISPLIHTDRPRAAELCAHRLVGADAIIAVGMRPRERTPAATVTQVASGVRQVSVGAPFRSHVYLIDGPDGPIAFDAAIKGTGLTA